MPRPSKGIRLYLRAARGDRREVYYIRHGSRSISTECGIDQLEQANQKLAEYIARHYQAPKKVNSADKIYVAEVLNAYLTEYAPSSPSRFWIQDMAGDILRFWEGKRLSDITRKSCDDFVAWRMAQPLTTTSKRTVSKATAGHELSVLRATMNYYRGTYAPTMAMPPVRLPKKSPPREGYFLDRTQLARRLRAAWRRPETRHVARLILLGIYSGSRLNTMLRLRWVPSIDTGWIDLDRETPIIFRRGTGEEGSKKRRSACLVHYRLLPHLRRWKAQDLAVGVSHVIHHKGQPIRDPYHAWESVRIAAGATAVDRPHALRHSYVTLFVKAKVPLPEIAAFTGMTTAVLDRYYPHQSLEDQENIVQTMHQKRISSASKRAQSR